MTERTDIACRPYRRLRLGLLIAGILLTICGPAADVRGAEVGDVAVVASTESPPYRMFEGGRPRGVFIDILEAVLRRVNLTSRYHVLPFKRCLAELQNGEADLFIGLFYRPEREAYVIYLKPTIAPYVTKVFYLNRGRARPAILAERYSVGPRTGVGCELASKGSVGLTSKRFPRPRGSNPGIARRHWKTGWHIPLCPERGMRF